MTNPPDAEPELEPAAGGLDAEDPLEEDTLEEEVLEEEAPVARPAPRPAPPVGRKPQQRLGRGPAPRGADT